MFPEQPDRQNTADAVIFGGDLNYRLDTVSLDGSPTDLRTSTLVKGISTLAGRRKLFELDPVNRNFPIRSFHCGDESYVHLPTYKRAYKRVESRAACKSLQPQFMRPCEEDSDSSQCIELRKRIQECYFDWKEMEKEKKQKTAKIGWLDRVCIKVRSKTRVHAYRERAYEEVDLSDHLPVRVGYQIVLEPTAVATSRALAAKPLPPEEDAWRVVDWAGGARRLRQMQEPVQSKR